MASDTSQQPKKSIFQRPLFKRPAAATRSRVGSNDDDLFSRTNSTYQAVVEEEEKRLAKRAAKVARRRAEQAKIEGQATNALRARSISVSDSSSSSNEESEGERKSSATRSSPLSPPQAKSATRPVVVSSEDATNRQNHVIEVLDLSDGHDSQETTRAAESTNEVELVASIPSNSISESRIDNATDDEDDVESDEELRELARRAREAEKLKQESSKSQPCSLLHSFQQGDVSTNPHDSQIVGKVKALPVEIEIQSPLPGTERHVYRIPLNKRLRDIRLRWCDGNGFSEEESADVVLVFRGKRVFDVNTPASLGISVDSEENPRVEGDDPLNPVDDGAILMEAIREDHLQAYIKDWVARHSQRKSVDEEEEDEEQTTHDDTSSTMPAPASEEANLRIICRAKDLDDFKVRVKGSTTVARIQWAFILQHGLSRDADINVVFDGETLEPNVTMLDVGVEDMNIFDIQIK